MNESLEVEIAVSKAEYAVKTPRADKGRDLYECYFRIHDENQGFEMESDQLSATEIDTIVTDCITAARKNGADIQIKTGPPELFVKIDVDEERHGERYVSLSRPLNESELEALYRRFYERIEYRDPLDYER